MFGKEEESSIDDESQWLSVSDLMAGLMMVFLFISIVLMRNVMIEKQEIGKIAATYHDNKIKIYNALHGEFKDDLKKWDAEINKEDLSFSFNSPDALFDVGKLKLKPKFKNILSDFFPRYLNAIYSYRQSIEEIRIEGHTSSRWVGLSVDQAYFSNMNLSQGRTRSVLSYIYQLNSVTSKRSWIKKNIAAVGYSSSKLIIENGIENSEKSRRVSLRVITNSEKEILKILNKVI
ncbi:MAG: OmpA family protein [Sulfurovaceae bacterium]|nr:OmpA family protein [Sulfurovaceae bacterium]